MSILIVLVWFGFIVKRKMRMFFLNRSPCNALQNQTVSAVMKVNKSFKTAQWQQWPHLTDKESTSLDFISHNYVGFHWVFRKEDFLICSRYFFFYLLYYFFELIIKSIILQYWMNALWMLSIHMTELHYIYNWFKHLFIEKRSRLLVSQNPHTFKCNK